MGPAATDSPLGSDSGSEENQDYCKDLCNLWGMGNGLALGEMQSLRGFWRSRGDGVLVEISSLICKVLKKKQKTYNFCYCAWRAPNDTWIIYLFNCTMRVIFFCTCGGVCETGGGCEICVKQHISIQEVTSFLLLGIWGSNSGCQPYRVNTINHWAILPVLPVHTLVS